MGNIAHWNQEANTEAKHRINIPRDHAHMQHFPCSAQAKAGFVLTYTEDCFQYCIFQGNM